MYAQGTRWLTEIRPNPKTKEQEAIRGIYSFTLSALMSHYNFTSNIFESTGGGGTGIEINGTWIGAVGDAYNGKSDFSFACGRNVIRNAVVSFTFPVSYEWLTFATAEPKTYYSWKAIYRPLSPVVWLCASISSIITIGIYSILYKALKQPIPGLKILKYLFSTLLEQSKKTPFRPSSPLRAITAFWLIFALVIGCAYRSKLVSFLAFPNKESVPRNFDQLSKSDYSIGLQYMKGAAYQLFKSSTNPTYKKIFEEMELEPSDVKCLQRTLPGGGKFSCITWSAIIDFVKARNLSDKYGMVPIVKAPVTINFIAAGYVTEYNAIFLEKFNAVIKWAVDSGLMRFWQQLDVNFVTKEKNLWLKAENRSGFVYPVDESISLTIGHLSGSFYILGIGLSAAGFCFVFEALKARKEAQNGVTLQFVK